MRRVFFIRVGLTCTIAATLATTAAAGPPPSDGLWRRCETALTGAWRAVFPESKMLRAGDKLFHVFSSPVGSGGEGVVWRLFDEPNRKLKVFTPGPEYAQVGEGRLDIARVGPLPQGYIRVWVEKIEQLRGEGFAVPEIYEVGPGYVVMEYIEGITFKQLGRKELGYSAAEIKAIRAQYWETAKRASKFGTIDGLDGYRNLIWNPVRKQWIIIDP